MAADMPKDTAPSAYEKWELPNIGTEKSKVTASEIEEIQEQARKEGFLHGHQEGVEQGLNEARSVIEQRLTHLDTILSQLAQPLEDLDEQVIQQTADLAMAVAQHIIRRELKTHPGEVIAVVRESVQLLPVSVRNVCVYLHPDDAILVRQAFSVTEEDDAEQLSWKIVEDPLLSHGGCKIQAENSSIDATIEKQLHRVIASILGGERADDVDE